MKMAIFQAMISPREAFEKLRERGGWVLGLILVCLLTAATIYVQWPLLEQSMIIEMERTGEAISEDNLELVMLMAKAAGWFGGLIAPVFSMFFVGLLLFFLNLILRGEATYMQLAKVALSALLPGIAAGLLTAALAASAGAKSVLDVTLTGGAFFAEKSGFLFTLVTAVVDPFGWWGLALLVIGSSVMMRKRSKAVAVWIVGVWLLMRVGSSLTALLPGFPSV